MDNSSRGDPVQRTAEDEAQQWLLLALSDEFSESDAERLHTWRRTSEQNEKAWQEAASTWRDAGEMREAFAPLSTSGIEVARGSERRLKLRPAFAGLAAAAAVLLAVVFAENLRVYFTADHLTWAGQMRKVVLPDRSVVYLNTDSAISLNFTPERRKVNLLEGEAVFDVQEDAGRPFEVVADDLSATVLGTVFLVRTSATASAVTVEEGRVRVAALNSKQTDIGQPRDIVLGASQHTEHQDGRGSGPITTVSKEAIAPWRREVILIDKLPFSQAVAELNRYLPGRILIAADTSKLTPVTARFSTRDIKGAVDALAATHGLNVNRLSRYLTILH